MNGMGLAFQPVAPSLPFVRDIAKLRNRASLDLVVQFKTLSPLVQNVQAFRVIF